MAFGIGQALKLVGGNPLMKIKSIIGEKLPITKSLDGGPLGGLMGNLLNGQGLQSIMSNPMGALTGQLQTALGGAAGQLTSALGGGAGGLVSALTGTGGLGQALGSLTSAGNGLLTGTGVLDVIGHAGVVDMLGSAAPANLSLDAVLAPINAEGALNTLSAWVPTMVADVIAGTLSVADATAQVQAQTVSVNAMVTGSATALSTVATMAPDIAAVSSAAAALVAAPEPIRMVLERALTPEALIAMRSAVATHLEP